jgi:sugar transferase EpsL
LLNDNYKSRLAHTSGTTKNSATPVISVKRVIDVIGAALGLLLFMPVMVLLAVLIRFTMGKGVLFRQQRPGLHAKPFTILKFKTMREAFDKRGQPLADADRLTRFGKFLRASSLDELPGLVNVLRGEMSFVGPRPLLMQYLERYTPDQARRHEVKPGITGWAQVNGRNAIGWEEKFKLDVWYVDNQSLLLDWVILWKTAYKVIFREGVSHADHATMPEFQGKSSYQSKTAFQTKDINVNAK